MESNLIGYYLPSEIQSGQTFGVAKSLIADQVYSRSRIVGCLGACTLSPLIIGKLLLYRHKSKGKGKQAAT